MEKVTSGYLGGAQNGAKYETVSSGSTKHAETIEIVFNPQKVSYKDLLEVFFMFHDPTTVNKQGADSGTQYRSEIFAVDKKQINLASKMIKSLSNKFENKIVTVVSKFESFYPAEDYHQKYYLKNGDAPYCQIVISPKLEKLKKEGKKFLKN